MPIADGAVFAEYRILRLLGTGGMGEVYLVQHPRLPRREALKILPSGVSADSEYRQRFAREADIAAALWHPHVVAVHDRGEHDGQLWITMDFVEGTDAAQLMRDRYPHGMPTKDVFEIVAAVAEALDYAHERYLLHRDVKPANILITDPRYGDRRILLADFGIARATNETSGLTATNMTVGSVAYAAPEQLMGTTLDGRADQYALACTAFHLLTGQPPFANSNPAVVIGNHLSSPPPRLRSRIADLGSIDAVLARAMAKEPFQRFDTCREFAAALATREEGTVSPTADTQLAARAAESPQRTDASAPSTPSSPRATSTARRAALIAGGIAALLAVGLVAFIGARLGQPQSAPPTEIPPASPVPPSSGLASTMSSVPISTSKSLPASSTPPKSSPPPSSAPPPPTGDLGLRTPISSPRCNGQGIVILGSVTTPGLYAAGVQRLLDAHPGAFYLRTDRACPSLRKATDEGNPIYAVFNLGGRTEREVCAAVNAVGGNAYGKWLDTTTDPGFIIPC
ncbi:serine/threonine-protein kinase [Mycolicibacterium komossense]|uniref:non-specific serine/threonine protein kinase n=1 Tax=Mycolicibacterium komossense TaxID=1779 RepID=A0ABT3CI13_9MYCO|nr:serine/threonine-protein kinase [Mycolicibacterium komossense]MCV7229082.1 serine/threonine protein kinase [Mycolicibacterium komossense]